MASKQWWARAYHTVYLGRALGVPVQARAMKTPRSSWSVFYNSIVVGRTVRFSSDRGVAAFTPNKPENVPAKSRKNNKKLKGVVDRSENEVAETAEALLVQTAISETRSSSTLAISREVSDGIKDLSEGPKEHRDERTLDAIHASLDTLNRNICKLQNTLEDSLQNQDKLRRIEFAIQNCKNGSFDYSPTGTSGNGKSTEDLVRLILYDFRLGKEFALRLGLQLPHYAFEPRPDEEKIASNQQFRDALTTQLTTLLGVTPVWSEPNKNGRRTIRYP
jgi:hypothetical protein